jgi:hypothetical protein
MSEHTPGPWKVQENADAYTHIVRSKTNAYICGCGQGSDGEDKANARLIAAAPELLEALNQVYDYLIGLHAYLLSCEKSVIVDNLESTSAFAYKQAELIYAAIHKAKGE